MAPLRMFMMSLLLASVAQMQDRSSFLSATVGENLTLHCVSADDINRMARIYWYKQRAGRKPELLSSFFRYDQKSKFHGRFQNSTRFTVSNNNNENTLFIANVTEQDSGVYHCVRCYLHQSDFLESVTVTVGDNGAEAGSCPQIGDGVWVYVLSGVTVFSTSLVAGLIVCLCRKYKADTSRRNSTARTTGFPKLLQYVATEQEVMNRGRGQMDDTWSECIYFSVKQ